MSSEKPQEPIDYRSNRQSLQDLTIGLRGVQKGARVSILTQQGDPALEAVALAAPNIAHLLLFVEGATDYGASHFMRLIAEAPNLCTLGFRVQDLGTSAMYHLSSVIERMRSLHTILLYAPVSEEQALLLSHAIKASSTLKKIVLVGFGSGGDDTFSAQTLTQAASMSHLCGKAVALTKCSAESCRGALAGLVAQSVDKRDGSVMQCPYTRALMTFESMNVSLAKLEIIECDIDDEIVAHLASVLAYDRTIRALRIYSGTRLSGSGFATLLAGIRQHPAMHEVHVAGAVSDTVAQDLCHTMATHPNLKSFRVHDPAIAESAVFILAQSRLCITLD